LISLWRVSATILLERAILPVFRTDLRCNVGKRLEQRSRGQTSVLVREGLKLFPPTIQIGMSSENQSASEPYDEWMKKLRTAFDSLNLPMADWQALGAFDYRREYDAGVDPADAAKKANRYWWREWNKSLNQDCRQTKNCWLPRGHQGGCQPVSEN
jgi:hypothetical protein